MKANIVGAGIAGLTAANALADAGHQVTVFEQSERLGGRAITTRQNGFLMNVGPHALYRGGIAHRKFKEWNIPISGKVPDLRGGRAFLVHAGELHPFFVNFSGLIRHPWFSFREKIELMRAMRLLAAPQNPRESSMSDWIANHTSSERVAQYLAAMVRLSTFCADQEHLSAACALAQIRLALTASVLYLDCGWQTIVDGLAARARSKGVEFVTEHIDHAESGTILAVPPAEVDRITGSKLQALRSSRMACLTLGLRSMPARSARFALGVDQSIYFSVHSDWAKVAENGTVLVHLGKYLKSGEDDDHVHRSELEAFADLAMPGWRAEADVIQFLPNMNVTHGFASVEGRPDINVIDGVKIAGDWVGDEGMLTDCAVASALRAAEAIQSKRAHAA
jgi:hypothetical protein